MAYFCTDPTAAVGDILGTTANRFSLEIAFRDCKQVVGAGQSLSSPSASSTSGDVSIRQHVAAFDIKMARGNGFSRQRSQLGLNFQPWPRSSRYYLVAGMILSARLDNHQTERGSAQLGKAGKESHEMRVLIVDDEADLARALRQVLEEDGYSVDIARDGEGAAHYARGEEYDAIVLDLMLPQRDGWAVLEEMRAEGRPTPVLILTARDSLADKVRGLNAGADDYLTKPFEVEEFLARIRALIRRSAGQPSPILKLGEIEVDTVARIVRRGGRNVDLTGKEYALVEFLVRNKGRIVSRSSIYDHIYDELDETLSNVVEVYISNLRKKLGREFITTRRGLGYLVDV